MSNISRRQFLKGAGVATLAVAAAGVLAGCSKEDVPVIPEVTTRPVMVADIDKKLLPEGYHLENEKAVVEIRKDASKGEHIIVFVTDVTYTPATKEVDIKVAITNPKAGEAVMTTVKANVKKDATTISAAEITLPDGFTWAEGTEMDRQYDIATYVFPIKHIA